MGVLCDYSRAPDRATAVNLVLSETSLFEAAESHPDIEVVDLKGVDPIVMLGSS